MLTSAERASCRAFLSRGAWFGGLPEGVPLAGLTLAAGILEVGGGALIMLGLLTRPVAFLLSGEMAVAYFIGHFSMDLFWPIENQGQLAVLFCFIFLFMSAYGGGDYSVDAVLRRSMPPGDTSRRLFG